MFCIYCGKKMDDTQKFCVFCGKPVESEEVTTQNVREFFGDVKDNVKSNVKKGVEKAENKISERQTARQAQTSGQARQTGQAQPVRQTQTAGQLQRETAGQTKVSQMTKSGTGVQSASRISQEDDFEAPVYSIRNYDRNLDYNPIRPWGYVGYAFLFAIPVIGWIFILIFALGGTKNANVRNFARSYLYVWILMIIILVIAIIATAAAGSSILSMLS